MSQSANGSSDPIKLLCKEMGFWDVLLFNIATVLGPRWIAAAAHSGPSSISLWIIAAVFFFIPSALVINELSSRFPCEGGLYIWAKEAFGDFHGFVAGWTYWIYTVFYFPGLLLASAAMSAYIIGEGGATLEHNRQFLLLVSLGYLVVAVVLNIIGLNIGKWLQNAGGVSTYAPLLLLVALGSIFVDAARCGDAPDVGEHLAGLELGYREFLVADCFCIHRARARLGHEPGSP